MSNDDKKLTDAEKKAIHVENGKKAKTREQWALLYEMALQEPERLLEKLAGDFCYGGDEARADLVRRVQEQRAWPEGLDFDRWWLEMATWSRGAWRSEEGVAWMELRGEVNTACNPYLRKEQCIHRHVYRINSRNLAYGAYNEQTGGFNGIREKFGRYYIFEEYHWDNGPPFGTVHPQEDLGLLPEGIEAVESLGTETKEGRRVWFDKDAASLPDYRYGRRRYVDTNEFVSEEDRRGIHTIHNDALFQHLQQWDPVPAGKE